MVGMVPKTWSINNCVWTCWNDYYVILPISCTFFSFLVMNWTVQNVLANDSVKLLYVPLSPVSARKNWMFAWLLWSERWIESSLEWVCLEAVASGQEGGPRPARCDRARAYRRSSMAVVGGVGAPGHCVGVRTVLIVVHCGADPDVRCGAPGTIAAIDSNFIVPSKVTRWHL